MASLSSNPPQGFGKAIEACNRLPEDLLAEMVRLFVNILFHPKTLRQGFRSDGGSRYLHIVLSSCSATM